MDWPDRVRGIWTRKRSWLDYLDRKAISRQVRRFLLKRKNWPFHGFAAARMPTSIQKACSKWSATAVDRRGHVVGMNSVALVSGRSMACDLIDALVCSERVASVRASRPGDERIATPVTLSLYEV